MKHTLDKPRQLGYNIRMNTEKKTTLISMNRSRGFQIKGLNGYTLSIGIGAGHYCDNYAADFDASECKPTSTMEVAVLQDHGGFVCLPHDVAGRISVANLGGLIQAVESHDWKEVCALCNENTEDRDNKFPKKV